MFTAAISYWFFGFDEPNFYGMFNWMIALAFPAFAGSMWGQCFGTFFSNEMTALQFNMMFIFIFNMGAGQNINLGKGVNYLAKLVSILSPIRYATEMLMRIILQGKPHELAVLNSLGMTNGDTYCMLALTGFCLALFAMGWVNLIRINRTD